MLYTLLKTDTYLKILNHTLVPVFHPLHNFTPPGSPLTASEAFTIFSIFSMMQMFFSYLPVSVRIVAEAKISMSRIQVRPDFTCTFINIYLFCKHLSFQGRNYLFYRTHLLTSPIFFRLHFLFYPPPNPPLPGENYYFLTHSFLP